MILFCCPDWLPHDGHWHFPLNTGLLIFRAVAEPRISREIHKNTRNPARFARNLTQYMSAQHIWKLHVSWLLGLLTRFKCNNLPWNFITAASKQHPKSTRHSHEITDRPLRVRTTKTLCLPTWKTNYNAEKCASDVKKMKNRRKQNFEGEANNMQLDKEDTRRSN